MSFKKESIETLVCPLDEIMNIISKKWTLLIINTIGNDEKVRYNEIMQQLKTINSKTLSDRLKELEKYGLIERKAYMEIPPRVEYSLTEKGRTLRKSILPLMEWIYNYRKGNQKRTPCDVAYIEAKGTVDT
ncbi:helix-turn-helix transcriptional regulator [Candidatus Bathyarchaeota archaeon]|nr:helix-turn-helix transcriptional regulator [Candidatus Bathyarchaeota archaeon]MBS7636806.1 helix-turn-helix transcriptional regulator [Candidatus Bathyarchaeota archaeon]